jgi:predicted GNAT family N-acyltransferase
MPRRKRRRAWKQQLELNRVVVRFPRPEERWDEFSLGRLVVWGEWRGEKRAQ